MSLLVSLPAPAVAGETRGERFIRALDRMMVQLAPQSARSSKAIRSAYQEHLDLLVLDHFGDLETALATGGIAPLPLEPHFNLAPRLTGPSPIGEKDPDHQVSYIAARPATIGALLDVASRVKSGPVEVTSLVRHTEYQGSLRSTNPNATTSVPMHTMGLAFDIALINTPLETVYEIRDVLLEMQRAGDILFIGERRQLVFHVVPHPARLGHFTNVYTSIFGTGRSAADTHVVAFTRNASKRKPTPSVTAEIVAVLPGAGVGEDWWAVVGHEGTDLVVEVGPSAVVAEPAPPAPVEHAAGLPVSFPGLALAAFLASLFARRPEPVALGLI